MSSAAAETVSATVGPVAVPNAPVEVCVDGDCQQTPALSSVLLAVDASADPSAGTLPTVTPGTCPGGALGGVLTVNGGSAGGTVGGTVSGTLPTGSSFSQPIGPVTLAPGGTAVVSACAAPSTGPLPSPPSPTGVLGLLLGLVQQLLGGVLGGGLLPGGGLPL